MNSTNASGGVFAALFSGVFLVVWLVLYLAVAYTQYLLAKKQNHPNPWYAFVPLLNLWQILEMASLDWWWLLLCFIPCINLFAIIYIYMQLAQACGKPNWWGLLCILPFGPAILNLVLVYT